jgi:hypothetical protein
MKSQMRMEFEARHGFEVCDDMDIQTSVAWDNWKEAWKAAMAHARYKANECADNNAEIERLRAESDERLKNTVSQAMEIERLKADAERYRWLRNKTPWTAVNAFNKTRIAFRLAAKFSEKESPKAGVNLDTAIDTAMKKTP